MQEDGKMPKLHKKPTQEELQEDINKAIAEAEAPEVPIVEPVVEDTPAEVVEPAPEPDPTPEPAVEPEADIQKELEGKDKKLSASARENQKILAKNRVLNQALDESNNTPEPTEEELTKEFPEWEVMDEVSKKLAKETVVNRKFREKMVEAREKSKKIEKWDEDVVAFAEDPRTLIEYSDLEGKIEEFKVYATQESNNNVPFKVLVGAFLHEKSMKPKNKGKMFEDGTGGPAQPVKPKSDKISMAEAESIRDTDYGKYRELLKAGKIDLSVE